MTETSASAKLQGLQSLFPRDSLSVENEDDILVSPNGTFSAGFYKVGTNAYCFSIWFTNSANRTVTWMANRDKPVQGEQSNLIFQKNGNLILTDAYGTIIWETNTFNQDPVSVQLQETGNLVLLNQTGGIIWGSFDSPTDTLLPHQTLRKANILVSARGPNNYSSGYYNFHFNDNNILSLIYNGPEISSVYWPNPDVSVFTYGRTPYDSSRNATLDELGYFISTDNLNFKATDYGLGPKRRLTLNYDGMLRLYSLNESNGLWKITWLANINACDVRGLCGQNGICVYGPKASCMCPPGFRRTDPSDWSKGCSPEFNPNCNNSEFVQLSHTDYYGYDLQNTGPGKSFGSCKNACLADCNCKGFAYQYTGQGNCYLKSILFNGYQMPNYPSVMYIRVPSQIATTARDDVKLNIPALNCSQRNVVIIQQPTENNDKHSYFKYLIGFVVSIGIVELICINFGWWFIKRIHRMREVVDMGYVALAVGFKRFTYDELKKATKNFKEEIGKGSFGAVYKGVLDDGRVVAVKRLERISQGEAEFWAEVSIIGRINHMNLVRMWGFCAEDKHRILVYEYMKNGSFDKFLFSNSSESLVWTKRFDIALGTAKGLSYLHEECLEWILHCDIKPQNILLDDQLQPKVADFGLSKLAGMKGINSHFSKVRGTRGYLAPEWIMNQEITSKADVYSYGIVLLELVSGRSVLGCQDPLVQWIEEKIKQDEGIEGVADPRLNGDYNHKQLKKLIEVALLCVRGDKKERPDMSHVVSILLRDD